MVFPICRDNQRTLVFHSCTLGGAFRHLNVSGLAPYHKGWCDLLSEEGFFSPLWNTTGNDELNNIPVFVVWIACCVPLTKKQCK